jgi:flagellar basal body-associated protein FliL
MGYRGFGMFHGSGGIFWIVLTVIGVLFAVKLAKDIFFSGKKRSQAAD